MKILRYTLTFCFVVFIGFVFSDVALSYTDIQIASPSGILPGGPSTELSGVGIDSAGDFIGAIIAWMIKLTAVLTVLAITWSGIQMVLAVGEEEKMKKARHTMIYAFIGLVIAGLAYAVVTLITNVDLDNFF